MNNSNTYNNFSFRNTPKSSFIPFSEPIKKAMNFFGQKIWNILDWFNPAFQDKAKENNFKPAFSWVIQKDSQETWFSQMKTRIIKDTLIEWLKIEKLVKSSFSLSTSSIKIPNKSRFYSESWSYIDVFPKNTSILSSVWKEIYFYDNQAFLYIDWHNNTLDKQNALESGYMRASWLDTYIITEQEKIKKDKTNKLKSNYYNIDYVNNKNKENLYNPKWYKSKNSNLWNQFNQERKTIFSWYKWEDWRDIPEYILKAVTINYFWKEFKYKIDDSIEKTNLEIESVRNTLIETKLKNKPKPKNIDFLSIQKENIKKKHKLTTISKAINEAFHWEKNEINPDLEKLIISIQKTKDWKEIVSRSQKVSSKLKKKK